MDPQDAFPSQNPLPPPITARSNDSSTKFSFETAESLQIHIEAPSSAKPLSKPPIQRERSFRSLFKKKAPVTLSVEPEHDRHSLHVPLPALPTFSDVSDAISHSSDEHVLKSSSKISAKWQVRKHNLDKGEESDPKLLEASKFLADKYYDAFNYHWMELAQHYCFGGLIKDAFATKRYSLSEKLLHNVLINWLLMGGDVLGHPHFGLDAAFKEDYDVYALSQLTEVSTLLKFLVPLIGALDIFKQAISHFKEHNDDGGVLGKRDANVRALADAADKEGFPIPLAQALYSNWVIQFENVDFSDGNVVLFFRRSARNSLVIKYLVEEGVFNELLSVVEQNAETHSIEPAHDNILELAPSLALLSLSNQEVHMFLDSFLHKDNQTALGLALYGVANALHTQKFHNRAINIFEISANLTSDLDCCLMAAVGLSNGYGYGKKHGKEARFHRKKRVASIYRIVKNNGGKLDMGTSWAFKEKYD